MNCRASLSENVVGLIWEAVKNAPCVMVLIGPPAYPRSWGHAALLTLIGIAVAGSLRAVAWNIQRGIHFDGLDLQSNSLTYKIPEPSLRETNLVLANGK